MPELKILDIVIVTGWSWERMAFECDRWKLHTQHLCASLSGFEFVECHCDFAAVAEDIYRL